VVQEEEMAEHEARTRVDHIDKSCTRNTFSRKL